MSNSKSRHNGPGLSPKDKAGGAAQPLGGKADTSLSSSGKSGRVAFDSRGNPTWEWQTSTGVFDRNVSTQRLKKLEAEELSIADTQSVLKPKGLALEEPTQLPGGGMNPYNTGPASKGEPTHLPKLRSHSMSSHKVAHAKKPLSEPVKPQGTWQKIKSKLLRDDE